MTAPISTIVQMSYQNPHAEAPLVLPVLVLCNTSDEDIERNVRLNAARDLKWIGAVEPHDDVAAIVGGGPSVADHLKDIEVLQSRGATVFALNAASKYLRGYGLFTDYQVMADAKPESAELVDMFASQHLFASQVHPSAVDKIRRPILWHLEVGGIERWFPGERIRKGGYSLIGGGAAVGNSACCVAYVMGYREMHLFGFDSSHRNGESHAYDQPMNRFIPNVEVEWAGKKFLSSVAMKAQAEKFQITGQALKQAGCKLHVYGDGLLQTMWNAKPSDLTERDKYRVMWQFSGYRNYAPGEHAVETFIELVQPEGMVVDFGCGTGRAGLALQRRGLEPFLIDFADNCRDEEAIGLPFLEWDLTRPIPVAVNFGMCCDVMEHIPMKDVAKAIRNIMASAKKVFFQISTVPDAFGAVIGQPLHLTVRSHEWWLNLFADLGFTIEAERRNEADSQFVISHIPQKDH